MNYNEVLNINQVDFSSIPPQAFLLGLLSAFDNRLQAYADNFFDEITWKQFFAIICINICKENPTLKDLAQIMGSSHQNVKQILLKLEKKDFVKMVEDNQDKRKQRIFLTEKCFQFCEKNEIESQKSIARIYEGINEEQLLVTIQTIMKMETNIEAIWKWL